MATTFKKSPYREADEFNERYMQPIMDQVYGLLGYKTERVEDKERQIRGADVILTNANGQIIVDEKCDNTRQLYVYDTDMVPRGGSFDSACTFAMEMSRRFRDGRIANGWIHPSERARALNGHFAFIWTNHVKDKVDAKGNYTRDGKLTQISQVEVCIIGYDAIRRIIENHSDNFSYDDEIAKVYEGVKGRENELVRFDSHGDTRMVYSGFLFEKPINCVISKKALRANADMAYAFNFEGDHGNEKAVSVRRLHCNGNKTEFDCGFVSLT